MSFVHTYGFKLEKEKKLRKQLHTLREYKFIKSTRKSASESTPCTIGDMLVFSNKIITAMITSMEIQIFPHLKYFPMDMLDHYYFENCIWLKAIPSKDIVLKNEDGSNVRYKFDSQRRFKEINSNDQIIIYYTYDYNGKLIQIKLINKENEKGNINLNIFYSSSGKHVEVIGEAWNEELNDFTKEKFDILYIDRTIQETVYNWNKDDSIWVMLPEKCVSVLNNQNKLIYDIEYIAENEDTLWEPDYKTDYTYNEFGIVNDEINYIVDTTTKEWIYESRDTHSYDLRGNYLGFNCYIWNRLEKKWEEDGWFIKNECNDLNQIVTIQSPLERFLYGYDTYGNLSTTITEFLIGDSVFPREKIEYLYEDTNNLPQKIIYYSKGENDWEKISEQTIKSANSTSILAKKISKTNNIVTLKQISNRVNLKLNNPIIKGDRINIFNVKGRLIHTINLNKFVGMFTIDFDLEGIARNNIYVLSLLHNNEYLYYKVKFI